MGFSWNYLTRRFLLQNHRDWIAMGMISSMVLSKWLVWLSQSRDAEFVMQHIYTHDESDISFREKTNMTDGAVKRTKILAYAEKIRQMRADKERAA